ncbi:DUF3325 family protein [Sphingomonas oryzagri]
MILFALILNALGFFSLAAAGDRCREALLGRGRSLVLPSWTKMAGACLVTASWLLLMRIAGFASSIVLFAGLSTIGAMISVLCVTAARHMRSRQGRASAVSSADRQARRCR